MDDHELLLGVDFMRATKAVFMPHDNKVYLCLQDPPTSIPTLSCKQEGPRLSAVQIVEAPRATKEKGQRSPHYLPRMLDDPTQTTMFEQGQCSKANIGQLEGHRRRRANKPRINNSGTRGTTHPHFTRDVGQLRRVTSTESPIWSMWRKGPRHWNASKFNLFLNRTQQLRNTRPRVLQHPFEDQRNCPRGRGPN